MTPVELTPGAQRDLARLGDFLVEQSDRAAIAAVEKIEAGIRSLREFSERGRRVREAPWRELIVRFGRDGYVIRNRVAAARVIVMRIFHARERR